ncbi:MAG: aminopeptidase P family protein [Endomicrobium sp.]|jgi:Xaa-Pro aminopeptidase|nr:aminopeptidase P family protein [Endomicrobium sp.]
MFEKVKILKKQFYKKSLLFTNTLETFYLTGANFGGFWILTLKGKICLIASKMIENQVREFFTGQNIHIYICVPFAQKAAEIIKEHKENLVLTDSRYISTSGYLTLKTDFSKNDIRIEIKSGILDKLRAVKSENEIKNLKEACRIVSQVCETVKSKLKPGIMELDVHYKILELFAKNKVKESFTPIVAAGKNSANPHHASSNYKIKKNDTIMLDIGCMYNGYCSDLTRTYYLGKINDKFRKIWDTVKQSQSAVLKKIKAGLPLSWADKTARAVIDMAGYKDNFIHMTGHGVGIEIHEMPSLSSDAEGIFLRNMAVTIEPGIYLNDDFGVRIEDTVLITDKGCEILTSAAYE